MRSPPACSANRSRHRRAAPAGRGAPHALYVEGRPTGLRLRSADGFWARAVGLLRVPLAGSAEVLLIPGCAAIHTLGMRRELDVAFVGDDGRVLRTLGRLRPWRFAWCRGACSTWEFPAGELARCGIVAGVHLASATDARPAAVLAPGPVDGTGCAVSRPGVPSRSAGTRRACAMRGAAMLEFLVAAVLVLLPLGLATLELAQLAVTRHALDYASFEAARSGAVHGADRTVMRRALVRALVPLFAPVDPVAVLRGGGAPAGGAGAAGVAVGDQAALVAMARAGAEVMRPDLLRLDIENPTAAAGRDFATLEDGERVIPNDGLDQRNPVGAQSGQSLREANVLAIRVRYCRRLVMPIIDRVVPAMLRLRLVDPFDQLCLAQDRVPIEARSIVHMQSPVRVAQLEEG